MASLVCKIMGLAFIAIGIWGFVDGQEVLIFHVNTAHNIVHIASGVLALLCGMAGEGTARAFCLTFGVVYAAVAVCGFMNVEYINDLLHLNDAGDYLHAGIAVIFLLTGLASKPKVVVVAKTR